MTDLSVATYNIHKGVGTDRRRDPKRIVRVINELNADIVALQEADRRFGDRAGVLDLGHLHEETGLRPLPLDSRLRAHGWHGNLILTRGGTVEDIRQITLPGLEPRGALMADLDWNGQPLRIVAAHFGLLRASRLLQARALDEILCDADDRPTVMMGDLNEWRIGNRCSLRALPLAMATSSAGLLRSYPTQMPLLPLDRILTTPEAEVLHLEAHASPLARKASDHLPLRARLRLHQPPQVTHASRMSSLP